MKANHAEQAKVSPAYVIAEIEIKDPAVFQQYAEKVPGTLAPFDGRYLIRGGRIHAIEGEEPKRFVVIAFDSLQKAQGWANSQAYAEIKRIRHDSAESRLFIVEGVAPRFDD